MRLSFCLAILLLFAGCGEQSVSETAPGADQIVRLSDSEIKGLDPQKISDLSSLRVAADQFEGLTRHNAAGEAEPGLAKFWNVSADGLEWTFVLRDNLKFSDQTPISASLFEQVFQRLKDPDTASPTRALFENIVSVRVQENRVVVALNAPTPQLPELLAHPAMAAIPIHRIVEAGESWTSDRPLITSGAYRMTQWLLNDHAQLTRNPEWHEGVAPADRIIWKPMDDSLSGMRLVLAGGADIASDYPSSRHGWLQENHPGLSRSVPYLGSYYFAFNTRRPPFDDRRVRVALSMATERNWIASKVMGIGNIPAWGLLPPGIGGRGTISTRMGRLAENKAAGNST